MFFLTSLASVCLRLRTISTARFTAATSIAAAVMMVLAGAGSACVCAAAPADRIGRRRGAVVLGQRGLQGLGNRWGKRRGGGGLCRWLGGSLCLVRLFRGLLFFLGFGVGLGLPALAFSGFGFLGLGFLRLGLLGFGVLVRLGVRLGRILGCGLGFALVLRLWPSPCLLPCRLSRAWRCRPGLRRHSGLGSVGRGGGGSEQNDESHSGQRPQRADASSLSHNLWSHRSSQWSFPSGGSTHALSADSYSVDKIDES